MKKFTKLEIDWIDSIHDSGWQRESEFSPQEQTMEHTTIGYFLYKTRKSIGVCQSYGLNRQDPTIDAIMQIPLVAITKIRQLK